MSWPSDKDGDWAWICAGQGMSGCALVGKRLAYGVYEISLEKSEAP